MQDNSTLSAKLQVWWEFVATLMPVWISANAITVGAVVPTVTCMLVALMIGFPLPRWFQVLCGLSVFAFQTFDAVDGKQARKLKSSSPLGDFLDHVIDSVSIMAIGVTLVFAFDCKVWVVVVALNMVALDFVIVHWEAAKIKVMVMDNGTSITEAQLVMAGLFLIAPIFGNGVWEYTVLFGLKTGEILALVIIVILPMNQVVKSCKRIQSHCGSKVFAEVAPGLGLLAVGSILWGIAFGSRFVAYNALIMMLVTILISTCVTLNRLAGYELSWRTTALVSVPILLTPFFAGSLPFLPHFCMIFTTAYVGFFLYDVVISIATTLGVPVFANPPHVYNKTQ
eukprot:TRINITY_DN6605_c0_g1_i1.p1 TRINITY_DN6605_c0_g1~~TRINITY_DN6605_c0_g1_i1.p1  ORF type:complete len:371 (+),score=98.23 TRINITY_DN6605_c0_g1_i1:98-1114(+)